MATVQDRDMVPSIGKEQTDIVVVFLTSQCLFKIKTVKAESCLEVCKGNLYCTSLE